MRVNNIERFLVNVLLLIVEGITSKILTVTLRELEQDKLITRKVCKEVPPPVEYRVSKKGKELIPFIDQMRICGEKQMAIGSFLISSKELFSIRKLSILFKNNIYFY